MSKTMLAPWISSGVLQLLEDEEVDPDNEDFTPFAPLPKVVQVNKVHEDQNILIVNDKRNYISVFLSPQCVKSFEDIDNQSLSSIENSLIKLENWHFSTIVQCIGRRNLNKVLELGISTPTAINCSRMSSLGAYGCSLVGAPVDINADPDVREAMLPMQYITLAERFARKTFGTPHLPDASGHFLLPTHLYGKHNTVNGEYHYVLKLHHCLIPNHQKRQLKCISSYGTRKSNDNRSADRNTHQEEGDATLLQTEVEGVDEHEDVGRLEDSVKGSNLTMHQALALMEDDRNSCDVDMVLRDTPSREVERKFTSDSHFKPKLLSIKDIMGSQNMGFTSPKYSSSTKFTASHGKDAAIAVEQLHTNSSPNETGPNSNSPHNQFYFSQSIGENNGGEDPIGTEVETQTSPEKEQATLMSSPLAESRENYLAVLKSQNESNMEADPYIDHSVYKKSEIVDKQGRKRPSLSPSVRNDLEDSDILTQPQIAYKPTPSPLRQNIPTSNHSSKKTRTHSPALSPTNKMSQMPQEATQDILSNDFYSEKALVPAFLSDSSSEILNSKLLSRGSHAEHGKYVGRRISKKIGKSGWCSGSVISFSAPYYLIKYDDGDIERNVSEKGVEKWLVANENSSESMNLEEPSEISLPWGRHKARKLQRTSSPKTNDIRDQKKNEVERHSQSNSYDRVLSSQASAAAKFALRCIFR